MVLSRLMKLEPKELMKEIVSGHVPLSMLNQVASRLPAEMLQEAVDFLSKSDSKTSMDSEPSSTTQPCKLSSLPLLHRLRASNFAKCSPIFNILSPTILAVNL